MLVIQGIYTTLQKKVQEKLQETGTMVGELNTTIVIQINSILRRMEL